MGIFDRVRDFERVLFASDPEAGLQAIIAVHSTQLGPALGGCRIQPYPDDESALEDALRLAEAMTWKAAAAGLDFGGGKAVVIADPARDRTEALLRALGRAVEVLGGRYITSIDVGSSPEDMDEIARETAWVTARSAGAGGIGDPSPYTAEGVAQAMRACLYHLFRDSSLKGRRIAIQGAGKVGYRLAAILSREGAELVIADPNLDNLARAVTELSVTTTTPEQVLFSEADIVAPCALGGVINERTIPKLGCRIVCGATNNQLGRPQDADLLGDAGILYAPDFIVNAGGLIAVADELSGFREERVLARVERIGRTVLDVFHLAVDTEVSTAQAAINYAKSRIGRLQSLTGR